MELELFLDKSVEQNAAIYSEQAKKARKKLAGLEKALLLTSKKLQLIEREMPIKKRASKKRLHRWFEAFHWFVSSDGFLVVGGTSAQSNETVVKKYLKKGGWFVHADIQGGSACVVQPTTTKVPESTLAEAAQFAAVFSKAWKQGIAGIDVYAVPATQVSKHAPSGEALGTGAFMVRGKRTWFRTVPLELWVGLLEENGNIRVISGPRAAVQKKALVCFKVIQGSEKASTIARNLVKKFKKKLPSGTPLSVDYVIKALPAGGIELIT